MFRFLITQVKKNSMNLDDEEEEEEDDWLWLGTLMGFFDIGSVVQQNDSCQNLIYDQS